MFDEWAMPTIDKHLAEFYRDKEAKPWMAPLGLVMALTDTLQYSGGTDDGASTVSAEQIMKAMRLLEWFAIKSSPALARAAQPSVSID